MPNYEDLIEVLDRLVPAGSVTTYAKISLWGYGVPNYHRPVGAMLNGARNAGRIDLTNRVVRANGLLADLPDGPEQQRNQLLHEGVPFTAVGNVDFNQILPVDLGRYIPF